MFNADFYIEKAKMVEGTAHLFRAFVSTELDNVIQARERRKNKNKNKKRACYNEKEKEEKENIVPIL